MPISLAFGELIILPKIVAADHHRGSGKFIGLTRRTQILGHHNALVTAPVCVDDVSIHFEGQIRQLAFALDLQGNCIAQLIAVNHGTKLLD